MKIYSPKQNKRGSRAQALVEFSIALPVLMVLLVGIMEAGRMVMMYALVTNASRDAVRYASAAGKSDDGVTKYEYCAGIRKVAKDSAFILNLQDSDITISYYHGMSSTAFATCPVPSPSGAYSVDINSSCKDNTSCDRVKVEVRATYSPVIKLIPLGTRNFKSATTRTILGIYDLPNH